MKNKTLWERKTIEAITSGAAFLAMVGTLVGAFYFGYESSIEYRKKISKKDRFCHQN